jgi:hypothetical protein
MIAFGCAVSEADAYRRYVEPGIALARESDSRVFAFASVESVARTNNLLLDAAAREEGLEALVLLHPHAEIVDPAFCAKLRTAFADPEVAVVGALGARGVRSIAWWEGEMVSGPVTHRYTDYRGGELEAFAWAPRQPAPANVDAVDPWVMALSPWAVSNLRFDEELVLGHGVEVDLCAAARAAGRTVMVADFAVVEHRAVELVKDLDLWVEAHVAVARKWAQNGAAAEDWRGRARRAEAQRESTRALTYFTRLSHDARLQALQRELDQVTSTLSWRLTSPLRAVNHWRRERTAVLDAR